MSTPAPLAEIFAEFRAVPDQQRLKLLLDYSHRLPELPEAYRDNLDQMDEVVECQTPLFLATEFRDEERTAEFFFAAPQEVPTTRGFAPSSSTGSAGSPMKPSSALRRHRGSSWGWAG